MNKKVLEALVTLKDYCESFHLDCRGCDFFIIDKGESSCYLMDRVPEEIEIEAFEEEGK